MIIRSLNTMDKIVNDFEELPKILVEDETVDVPKDTADIKYNCQHKRAQEIYIAADGTVYPCCYLGFYPGQMTHPGNEQLLPLVKENNALEYGLEHSMAWFDAVEATWTKSSIREGRLYQCVNSCGATK